VLVGIEAIEFLLRIRRVAVSDKTKATVTSPQIPRRFPEPGGDARCLAERPISLDKPDAKAEVEML
jgi:hypothetical protein